MIKLFSVKVRATSTALARASANDRDEARMNESTTDRRRAGETSQRGGLARGERRGDDETIERRGSCVQRCVRARASCVDSHA